jgi:NOL1/NOP2/fmu family ribosome biogenesis protein
MQKLEVLNTREKKKIIDCLKEQYGFSGTIEGSLLTNKDQKIFLITPDIAQISRDQDKELRVDAAGLYIGRIEINGIRLSMEGSQLIGPHSKKHVLEIDEEHLEHWVKGEDFTLSEKEQKKTGNEDGFFIIKFGNDYMGCGQIKNNNLRSLVSKERRLKNLNR